MEILQIRNFRHQFIDGIHLTQHHGLRKSMQKHPITTICIFDATSEKFMDNSDLPKAPYSSIGGCLTTNNTHLFNLDGNIKNWTITKSNANIMKELHLLHHLI